MTFPSGSRNIVLLLLIAGVLLLPCISSAERVLLIRPEASARYFHADRTAEALEQWLGIWQELLATASTAVDVQNESALSRKIDRSDLLILPNAVCLSDDQAALIRAHYEDGGGVLLAWATGSRTEAGDWRGYALLQSLMGALPFEPSISEGEPLSIELRWGVPGTLPLSPGQRLKLTLSMKPLALPQTANATTGGYWADYMYHNTNPEELRREVAFAVAENQRGGRLVWFGANLDGLHPDSTNREAYDKFFAELLRWLRGEAAGAVSFWPMAAEVGFLIHGDIEDKFQQVKIFTKHLQKLKLPSTFNILTSAAADYPAAMAAMKECGGELGIHGDNHQPFAGQTHDRQLNRLAAAMRFIEVYSDRPRGFRPPETAYDENTLACLARLNMTYLLADNYPDRASPRAHRLADAGAVKSLVFFPKSELDDYDLKERFNFSQQRDFERLMWLDFERIRDLGGLYKLNYHSQFLADTNLTGALRGATDKISALGSKVWIANARDIAEWTIARESARVSLMGSSGKTELTVVNASSHPLSKAVVRLLPPKGIAWDRLAPVHTTRNCTYDNRDGGLFLYLPTLSPGEVFEARFEDRGGVPINPKSKRLFTTMIIILVSGIALFCGAVAWYFVFTRKRKVSVLTDDPLNGWRKSREAAAEDSGAAPPPRSLHIPAAAEVMSLKPIKNTVDELRETIRQRLSAMGEGAIPVDGATGVLFIGETSYFFAFTSQGKLTVVTADNLTPDQTKQLMESSASSDEAMSLEPSLAKLTTAASRRKDPVAREAPLTTDIAKSKFDELRRRRAAEVKKSSGAKPLQVKRTISGVPHSADTPAPAAPKPSRPAEHKRPVPVVTASAPSPERVPETLQQKSKLVPERRFFETRAEVESQAGERLGKGGGRPPIADDVGVHDKVSEQNRRQQSVLSIRPGSGLVRVSAPPPPGLVTTGGESPSAPTAVHSFSDNHWMEEDREDEERDFQAVSQPDEESREAGSLRTSVNLYRIRRSGGRQEDNDDWR